MGNEVDGSRVETLFCTKSANATIEVGGNYFLPAWLEVIAIGIDDLIHREERGGISFGIVPRKLSQTTVHDHKPHCLRVQDWRL